MEKGALALLRILGISLLLGGIIVGIHPAYRATAQALWRGDVESSPLWTTNANFYEAVSVDAPAETEAP